MTDEIKFEMKGLEELSKNLDNLTKKLEPLKEQEVSFNELFPSTFMMKYTQFKTINEMVEKSPFKVESGADFKNIPDKEWDNYVKEKTSFQSWNEMMSKAGKEYLGEKVQKTFGKVLKK